MLALNNEKSTSLLACTITLIVLSTTAVIMRLISRRISPAGFWWDDMLTIISLLNSYAAYAIAFIDVRNGVGRHFETVAMNQRNIMLHMIYASQVHYPFGISTIKLAILLFYLRLFRSHEGFKKIIYATGALVICWFVGQTFLAIFKCSPISAAFVPDAVYQKQHCINANAWLISMSVFNILLDFWILVLPMCFVWTLHLSSRRKAGVSCVFLLGAFTIGASIVKAYYVFSVDLADITWTAGNVVFWSIVEISVGVICACLPTLQPILGFLGRKFWETKASWSRRIKESKDLSYLESSARQEEGTTPISNMTIAPPQLTLDKVSLQVPDYEDSDDDAFKRDGISHSSQ